MPLFHRVHANESRMAPLTNPLNPEDPFSSYNNQPWSSKIPLIFRRIHKFHQMDFELAAWQLTYLCLAPKRVYRNVYFHKQTKNTWARDDPAILVLISACLAVTGVAWSLVYSRSFVGMFELVFLMIVRDFLLSGAVLATLTYLVSNHLLLSPPTHSSPEDAKVEWAYCFDVHINSFFPMWLTLYVAQLFLLPVVLRDNWVCLWVGNTLWLVALSQYIYTTYLGLTSLPFLIRTSLFLSPLLPLFVGYVISLLGFNVAKHALGAYFGS